MDLNNLAIIFIDHTLLLISLILLLPITILFTECFVAFLPDKKQRSSNLNKDSPKPSVAILVAAHNEETVIGETLSSMLPQLSDRDKLIVIADNCTDNTAEIARGFHATVIERTNSENRGKGYALDYGLQSIQNEPYDVVIVIDADCHIEQNFIESLAIMAMASQRPVQPINLLHRANESNLKSAISELAFVVKNLVRPKGLSRMNLPCMLTMGTAFPWSIINQVSLASNNLVEDMQFGIDLAIAGSPPLFCSTTKVQGVLPLKNKAAQTQRTRWEHGHLSTLRTQVPRLLKESWKQKRLDLLAIAIDLSIPPLSFLVILWFAFAIPAITMSFIEGRINVALNLILIEGIALFMGILLAWVKFGRAILPFKSLVKVPLYILWKVPIYFRFLIEPQKRWVRTERDAINIQTQLSSQPSITS